LNKETPKIPNIKKKKKRKSRTLPSIGKEDNKDLISLLILGTALILLSGLITLNVLKYLSLGI